MSSLVTPVDRLGLTLFFAVALHAVIILGITFSFEPPAKRPDPDRTLEIMVVQNPKSEQLPEQADFLAQVNQQGGGENLEKVRPTTPLSSPAPQIAPTPAPPSQPAPVEPRPPPKQQALTAQRPAKKQIALSPKRKPEPKPRKKLTANQLLASTSREIARITAELERKQEAYGKRPRRKVLDANTRQYEYAAYLEAWRKKVERIGNLNYPDEARRRKLYGNLILHVALRADGSVKEIIVKRSSGHRLLDDAAVRIVKLAAPYAPFPPEIRAQNDILDIIRTWQFRNNNRLSTAK